MTNTTADHTFPPGRVAALARLDTFLPKAGRAYAASRNYDRGPGDRGNISALSPYIRHRLISEAEIVTHVLSLHSPSAAEKFIQEVCWRTYWKGWLEHRPGIYDHYFAELKEIQGHRAQDNRLNVRIAQALAGETGIACFDAWVGELIETGYLHNHARMWFASIWIFTLDLPWALGADFFLRHLLDGDPASNTLSWRWVAGLHTAGKTYLARADNIAHYTGGRFQGATALAGHARALPAKALPNAQALRTLTPLPSSGPITLLITEEDTLPERWAVPPDRIVGLLGIDCARAYPEVSERVVRFKQSALSDAITRARNHFSKPGQIVSATDMDGVGAALGEAGETTLVTAELAVGPAREQLRHLLAANEGGARPLVELRNPWDEAFWPHAKSGFFKLKEKIPTVLARLEIGDRAQGAFDFAAKKGGDTGNDKPGRDDQPKRNHAR